MDELHQRVVGRIREITKKRGIALTHLPDRAGVGRSHFWDVMAGRSSPTLAWVGRIAVALDVDAGELVVAVSAGEEAERPRGRRRRS